MFGYIQPLKCELRIREYDYYRAAYCGLCNSLRKRCGIKARFIVNYDFVFAALLLSYSEEKTTLVCKKRCLICPSGRNCVISEVYDKVADICVILTYLKLCDDIKDDSFFEGLFKARVPRMFLRNAYKRAKANIPGYSEVAKKLYEELNLLESQNSVSLDVAADKFAKMLEGISELSEKNKRIFSEIFYHIGRFIYIIDALDDFEDDFCRGEYNPIALRYSIKSDEIPDDVLSEVIETIEMSRESVSKAFELLEENENSELLRNIIELGMKASLMRTVKKEKKQ